MIIITTLDALSNGTNTKAFLDLLELESGLIVASAVVVD
jgi:hypothetical protein